METVLLLARTDGNYCILRKEGGHQLRRGMCGEIDGWRKQMGMRVMERVEVERGEPGVREDSGRR